MAAALSVACGQPFRIATSGSQRGRDGDSAFDEGATYFEAKRYKDAIPKEQIAVKLMDLAADNAGQVDTWVLCATVGVGAQDARIFETATAREGICLLLLDWSQTSLPPLATLLGIAAEQTKDFFRVHLPGAAQAVCDAVDHIANAADFGPHSKKLLDDLHKSSMGLGLAKSVNRRWLESLFSNRILAQQLLGQFLAPGDPKALALFTRKDLEASMRRAFVGAPKNSAFVVMGDEGVGKSWLVAKAWLETRPSSMLAIATAADLQDPADLHDVEDFVIRLLIPQTGNDNTEASKTRWKRRLKNWEANPAPSNIRLTLWIDGLEQAPRFPWARWIGAAALFLEKRGCRLVVTTRSAHYGQWRNALSLEPERIVVPNWTPEELISILRSRGIDGNTLNPDVFSTLRNPRILAIAVELLDARSIVSMNELSVGRLLFEHVRQSDQTRATPLSGAEFAKTLQELAAGIVNKLKSDQLDDLRLVDTRMSERIRDASSSRIFKPLEGDPDLYTIQEDGLQLALGLWLVSALEQHLRNNRNPAQKLAAMLEPISALDMTAEVVACAVEIACLQDSCSVVVTSALLRSFVSLQNAQDPSPEALAALARKAPEAFLQALEDAALSTQHINNIDWLLLALHESRSDTHVWNAIANRVPRWLATHSLSPDQKTSSADSQGNPEKTAEERAKASAQIEKAVSALTDGERALLETHLRRNDQVDPEDLHRYAFRLLAGKPLAEFALSFVAWAFGQALNSSFFAPREEFEHLIRMNISDWTATRDALHEQTAEFLGESPSRTGAWALVAIQRATGDAADARMQRNLVEELTRDHTKFPSWRLIESYCETDPCDPSSTRGERVTQTAQRFEALQESEFRRALGVSAEDHFFLDTLPAMARFEPEAAIATIRRLAKDASQREEPGRRLAIFALLSHSAIFDDELVDAFVEVAKSIDPRAHDDVRETWVSAQYALLTALPHLDGESQLKAIRNVRGQNLLFSLLESLEPADVQTVEDSLREAVNAGDEDMQTRVLAVINYTRAPLSSAAKTLVAGLLESGRAMIRTQALGVIAKSDDSSLLRLVAESDWTSEALNPDKDVYEVFFGSTVLLKAASAGLIGAEAALDRIALSHYGRAAILFGPKVAAAVAKRVSDALILGMGFRQFPNLPDVEKQSLQPEDQTPSLVQITDVSAADEPEPAETDRDFAARQKRAQVAYREFSNDLTSANARFILTDLGFDGVASVIAERPDLVDAWVDGLIGSAEPTRRALQLFAVQLMRAIAPSHPDRALALWGAIEHLEPIVRYVTGPARIPVDRLALWHCAGLPELRARCFRQLDEASSDYAIAVEVLAAFSAGHAKEVAEYVDALLQAEEPSKIARALMVSGFSDVNSHADAVLSRFPADEQGFIGTAAAAARYAYERNAWSRHWHAVMATATDPEDFWRHSILLEKIVDGRIVLWQQNDAIGETYRRFFATVEGRIGSRIQKWDDKRRKKLFGDTIPIAAYLPAHHS